jgi:hypothetical protein
MGALVNPAAMESYTDSSVALEGLGDTVGKLWSGFIDVLSGLGETVNKSFKEMTNLVTINIDDVLEQRERIKAAGDEMINDKVTLSNWKPLYSPKHNNVSTDIKELREFIDQAIKYSDLKALHASVEAGINELRSIGKSAVKIDRISTLNQSILDFYDMQRSKKKMIGYSPIRWIENNFIYQGLESSKIMLGNVRIYGVGNVGKSDFDEIKGKLFLQRLTVDNESQPSNMNGSNLPALTKKEALAYNVALEKMLNDLSIALNSAINDSRLISEFEAELKKLQKTGTLETIGFVLGVLTAKNWLKFGAWILSYFITKNLGSVEGVSTRILTRGIHAVEAMHDYIEANIKNYK